MTSKERMMAAIRGEIPDRIPYAPRLENWYIANLTSNTLPEKYKDSTLTEILDDIGADHHPFDARINTQDISLFYNLSSKDFAARRGIGLQRNLPFPGFTEEITNVDIQIAHDGPYTIVKYHTPVGMVSAKMLARNDMFSQGMTDANLVEEVIKEEKDYETVGYIFKNINVVQDYEKFDRYMDSLGDKTISWASGHLTASPMHHILHDLMNVSQFYLEMYDNPNKLAQLVEDMTPYFDAVVKIIADSPTEIARIGCNFHEMITYPPFFQEHMLPWLRKYADLLHSKGKFMACHTDGENQKLLSLYPDTGMDIAESICGAPMFKSSITELREILYSNNITMFGCIPSIVLLEESFSDKAFNDFMRQLFKEIDSGDRIILGVSDTTPPDAKFDRLFKIREMIR